MYKYNHTDFISNLYEGVYIVDKSRKIVFWNSGSEEITGYKSEEVVNSKCYNNILKHVDKDGKSLCLDGCPLQDTLITGKMNENHVFLEHKHGYRIPVSVKTIPLYDDKNNITAAVEVFKDLRLSEIHYNENIKLKEIANVDLLTDLYNRRYLDFQLENWIKEAKSFDLGFALLFFDIDYFKNINDAYGHNIGDEILKVISNTLKSNLRPGDIVGRWGGEEFIAMIKTNDNDFLFNLAQRLRRLCQNSSYKLKDKLLSVSVSIGATFYHKSDSGQSLIARADQAMYQSKQTGRNKVTII